MAVEGLVLFWNLGCVFPSILRKRVVRKPRAKASEVEKWVKAAESRFGWSLSLFPKSSCGNPKPQCPRRLIVFGFRPFKEAAQFR